MNPDHLDPVTARVNQLRGNSPAGINGRKRQCINGHDYTPENTYLRPDNGGRQCRICIRERSQKQIAKRKAARAARRSAA